MPASLSPPLVVPRTMLFQNRSRAHSPTKVRISFPSISTHTHQNRIAATSTSPIQTTTNQSTSTPTQRVTETAQSTLSKIAEVGTLAAGTAAAGAATAYEKITGTGDGGMNKSADVMPAHQTATLPSQELFGQSPKSGPMDGVGALPGHRDEAGVAILPDDKGASG